MLTAAKYNETELFEFLRKEGADPTAALILAAEGGEKQAVNILLVHGANVNGSARLPSQYCLIRCAETPLLAATGAIFRHDDEILKLLLSSGADVNVKDSSGTTPLMRAALDGNLNTVRMLLDKGADVNAKTVRGKTALMYACDYGPSPEVVELLLAKGADANEKDAFGRTALNLVLARSGEPGVKPEQVNAAVAVLKRNGAK